ncbi:MAG: hypothetical protein U0R44_04520 [Candidatus Micrarchaeia archaeon]
MLSLEKRSSGSSHRPCRAFLTAALAISMLPSSCSGRVNGDERSSWLPAVRVDVAKNGAPPEAMPIYAGIDERNLYGVTHYFDRYTEIPSGDLGNKARVVRLIIEKLSESFDLRYETGGSILRNDAFIFMDNPGIWPSAVYMKDAAVIGRMQFLSKDGSTIADCGAGDCPIRDLIALKLSGSFKPSSDTLSGLTESEYESIRSYSRDLSEEVLHDYYNEWLSESERSLFVTRFSSLWETVSIGKDDDGVFSEAWRSGGIAFAIDESGAIKPYMLKVPVTTAISEFCPSCTPAEVHSAEIAAISFIQVIGAQASSFMGSSQNYLGFYMSQDASQGKPDEGYGHYRKVFIERESYSHVGRGEKTRVAYPKFLRSMYEPFCRSAYLDKIFSDGLKSEPAVSANPYLSDYDSFRALVSSLIPLVLKHAKG